MRTQEQQEQQQSKEKEMLKGLRVDRADGLFIVIDTTGAVIVVIWRKNSFESLLSMQDYNNSF